MSTPVQVKILSYKSPQRYAVRHTLQAAQNELRKTVPQLALQIIEVKVLADIEAYTNAIILPSLVVNEKLVCIGRFPKKCEVIAWLQDALQDTVGADGIRPTRKTVTTQ
jgi:hypothetical protein